MINTHESRKPTQAISEQLEGLCCGKQVRQCSKSPPARNYKTRAWEDNSWHRNDDTLLKEVCARNADNSASRLEHGKITYDLVCIRYVTHWCNHKTKVGIQMTKIMYIINNAPVPPVPPSPVPPVSPSPVPPVPPPPLGHTRYEVPIANGSVPTVSASTLLKKQPPSALILIAALQPGKARQASKHAWLLAVPPTELMTSPWTSTPGRNSPHGVAAWQEVVSVCTVATLSFGPR